MNKEKVMSENMETLAEIHEKCLSLLAAASLPVGDRTHVQGLKAGIEEILDMTGQAYSEVCDD